MAQNKKQEFIQAYKRKKNIPNDNPGIPAPGDAPMASLMEEKNIEHFMNKFMRGKAPKDPKAVPYSIVPGSENTARKLVYGELGTTPEEQSPEPMAVDAPIVFTPNTQYEGYTRGPGEGIQTKRDIEQSDTMREWLVDDNMRAKFEYLDKANIDPGSLLDASLAASEGDAKSIATLKSVFGFVPTNDQTMALVEFFDKQTPEQRARARKAGEYMSNQLKSASKGVSLQGKPVNIKDLASKIGAKGER